MFEQLFTQTYAKIILGAKTCFTAVGRWHLINLITYSDNGGDDGGDGDDGDGDCGGDGGGGGGGGDGDLPPHPADPQDGCSLPCIQGSPAFSFDFIIIEVNVMYMMMIVVHSLTLSSMIIITIMVRAGCKSSLHVIPMKTDGNLIMSSPLDLEIADREDKSFC